MHDTLTMLPVSDVHLDDDNVRLDTDDRSDLIASITQVGILEPLLVRALPEGGYRVTAGERRYLSAKDAGLTEIPCIISTDEDRAVALKRLHENIGRDDFSPAELARGVQQVLSLGGDLTQLAAGLNLPKTKIKAMAKVAQLPDPLIGAVHHHKLTLMQASTLGAIEAQDTTIGEWALEHILQGSNAEYVLAQAQQKIDLINKITQGRTIAEGMSIPFLDTWPDDASEVEPEDIDTHQQAGCLAIIVDANTQSDVDYACLNYDSHWVADDSDPDSTGHPAEPTGTDDEAEAHRQAASAQRKRVIANNKAFDLANATRTAWLDTFKQRKTAPKGALLPIGRMYRLIYPDHQAHQQACEAMGLPYAWSDRAKDIASRITSESEALRMMMLAVIITAENRISREIWRHADSWVLVYLTALEGWGYTLTPPEVHLVNCLANNERTEATDYPVE